MAEAQEADEAAGADMAAGAGDAGIENRLLHRVDERINAVFIINANGVIQMGNKVGAQRLLTWYTGHLITLAGVQPRLLSCLAAAVIPPGHLQAWQPCTSPQNACTLLGYSKGDLDGKNINIIMPPPFSQRHNKYVRQYVHTGRETILNMVVSLPALHKDRYVIPVRVGVTKVSGAAESSTFMGVLEVSTRGALWLA